ncbi:hypothetical protein ASPZODRAFT_104245 [Penicilliopsis zonata CBS 506.65]|uniref:Cell division control protein n=1 Tax=Penicilliopsis zonata CBS 506.65 TaxID=1073090 RepID=A0A1L9S721_9EURO|nr:hypothetical protein ASPZODRAFT_104245 [Penicilliopsis zonata CBS 506.65]OJJ42943.1 hypothetical protein ASPZODRAFT_104245 [Penicilliopsis zonata CBS 506.65]
MAVSVLGKRQRDAFEPEVLPLRTSSKRRTRTPRILQEETEPSVSTTSRQLRSRTRSGFVVQENNAKGKSEKAEDAPSKHTAKDGTAAPCTKIEFHPSSSGVVNDENSQPVEFKTPQKTRFRNALDTTSPVTPKRRVQINAKSLTPRTPRQVSTPAAAAQTVYTQARQLFARGSRPSRLVGRETERGKLTSFIEESLQLQRGGCLYVSGPPGTGKSAMVDEVCREMDIKSVKVTHVNCASMRTARDIHSRLIGDLCDDSQVFKKNESDRLKAMFVPEKKEDSLYLVTLDEIDHLLASDPEVLQSLFEWSLHSMSRLILIGIANALDLTDRSLPKLKAKNLKPRLLPFLPYNAAQIAGVITNLLRSLLPAGQEFDAKFVPFVQPAAIQLCSKKVASQTGDLRKAFELVRRAIDVIEQETLQKLEKQNSVPESPSQTALAENNNLSSPARTSGVKQNPMSMYTPLTAPRASIAHVARITSSVFGQGTMQRLQGLNLQQKAVICALIAFDRKRREGEIPGTPSKSRNSAPTAKQLFDTYCALCRNDNILHPLTATEFKDVIGSLETLGLVGEVQGRGRGGTVAGGSDLRRTPSKSSNGPGTPRKAMDEQGLACFVSEKEVQSQISGPGEGILRRLLTGEGL